MRARRHFWYGISGCSEGAVLVSIFVGDDQLFADVDSLGGTQGADTEVGFVVHLAEEVVVVSLLGGE